MDLVKKLHSFFTCIPGIKNIKKKKEKENPFWLKNGGILLEELIATCNGVYNPIRIFSIEELLTATNNFQSSLEPHNQWGTWYKGTLDGHPILLKKKYKDFACKRAYRDIAISIKMSDHNNVLKLLGCCLELPDPILVFEDAEFGPLDLWLKIDSSESCSFPWKSRLKVAKDIAHALTFLHTAFATPIVHWDITPWNILLDKDYNAKLTDFSLSISIPEGETIVQDNVKGTFGYVDPEYMITGYVSEQSDVFSFGAFMIVLLTGKSLGALMSKIREQNYVAIIWEDESEMAVRYYINHKPLDEVVDSKIWEEDGGIRQEQRLELEAYLQMALRCTEYKSGDRPLMIDVANELRQIERGQPHNSPT